jgi:stearoyl-CoA desaturase (delta-9 desaturase)
MPSLATRPVAGQTGQPDADASPPLRTMATAHRYANLAAVVLPAAGIVVAGILTWDHGVALADVCALVITYALSGIGITVGFHRLLTHRSFVTVRWLELTLAVLGTTSAQGPVIMWVADHRKHHALADRDGDPHSPHTDDGGILHGLWHAHVGWLLHRHGQADWNRHAPEMQDDRALRRISRLAGPIVLSSWGIIFGIGLLLAGSVAGGARMLLWAGLVRIFLFQHFASFAVNSLCHTFGRRRFVTSDHSTNLAWLALPSLGEAWHHNHHAFPRSATHGLRPTEMDVSGYVIRGLERVGLAHDVVRVSSARQAERRSTG